MTGASESDAHLDPWCAVPLETGETILFGYALHHAETGGLAWLSGSELLDLDVIAGRARTRSGRRNLLGRRFAAVGGEGEGEEARLAFQLLIGVEFEDLDDLVEVERRWLQASKAARHLAVAQPARTDAATRALFREHGVTYLEVRRRDPGRTS